MPLLVVLWELSPALSLSEDSALVANPADPVPWVPASRLALMFTLLSTEAVTLDLAVLEQSSEAPHLVFDLSPQAEPRSVLVRDAPESTSNLNPGLP